MKTKTVVVSEKAWITLIRHADKLSTGKKVSLGAALDDILKQWAQSNVV